MTLILGEIREQIDSLDNQIHDLIMRRAALVDEIAKEKKKKNLPMIQPARETHLIRRLLKRHHGKLPKAAIIGIWRELIGAICSMQADVRVVIADHADYEHSLAMAKQYYGSVISLNKTPSDLMAVAALRNGDAMFAVVPWPMEGVDNTDDKTWWEHAFTHDHNTVNIIGALPYAYPAHRTVHGFNGLEKKDMIISAEPFNESGHDHTCYVLRIDHSVSRGRIVEVFEDNGLKPISLHTKGDAHFGNTSLHMIIVEGYQMHNEDFVASVKKSFEEFEPLFKAVGGYAVPFALEG